MGVLRYALLGGLDVANGNGPVPLGTRKQRAVLAQLEPAELLAVLEQVPDGPFAMRFTHDLMREAIAETVTPLRARRMHCRSSGRGSKAITRVHDAAGRCCGASLRHFAARVETSQRLYLLRSCDTVCEVGHGPTECGGSGSRRGLDGAVMINVSRLTACRDRPRGATATVGGGAKWAAVLNPAQEHGLAPLLGSTTDVGAVGYTLGGGMGWLARRYRLAGAVYLNFLDGEDRAARAAKAFSEENLTRLRRVKAALDPGNRFCHGFGIA